MTIVVCERCGARLDGYIDRVSEQVYKHRDFCLGPMVLAQPKAKK